MGKKKILYYMKKEKNWFYRNNGIIIGKERADIFNAPSKTTVRISFYGHGNQYYETTAGELQNAKVVDGSLLRRKYPQGAVAIDTTMLTFVDKSVMP